MSGFDPDKTYLIVCCGIPGSGKDYWAAEEQQRWAKKNRALIISNKDELRLKYAKTPGDIHTYKHNPNKEHLVNDEQVETMIGLLESGTSVVVTDCNLSQATLDSYKKMAYQYNALIVTEEFHTEFEVCWQRNLKRYETVALDKMIQMEKSFRKLTGRYVQSEALEDTLPTCILVDLDGTIAVRDDAVRSPYELDKVGLDDYDYDVIRIANTCEADYTFIMSGREDYCRDESQAWLDRGPMLEDDMFMRPTHVKGENQLPDDIVKEQLFNEHIRGKYRVLFVIDDRGRVARKWETMGLKVINVGGYSREL